MKLWKRISTLAMALLLLACLIPVQTTEAANACKQISGNSKAAKVFYVNTGSRWIAKTDVVKIAQTKGTMKIHKFSMMSESKSASYPPFTDKQNSTLSMYEVYTVKVEKLGNKNKVTKTQTYTMNDSSLKIKLDKNSKYRITVTPTFKSYYDKCKNMSYYQWFGLNNNYNPYLRGKSLLKQIFSMRWVPLGWKTHSTWKVSSTKGINDCSFQ